MCFSATASFAAAGVLAGIGMVSVKHNTSRRHQMLALIPFFFSVQQAAEGIVWLTLNRPDQTFLLSVGINSFVGFALVVWPLWLPISLLLIEKNFRRRRLIKAAVGIGVAVSTCGALVLVFLPLTAKISEHSITYDYPRIGGRVVQLIYFGLYLIPAVIPTFLSTMKLARWIGSVLVVALITTIAIKVDALTSVWCFFSTALSCLIVLSAYRRQQLVTATA
jgi:hypothetical protein